MGLVRDHPADPPCEKKQQRNLAAPAGENRCKKRFGGKKQIFGMKSQAPIFNHPLRWQDGQFSFHLSLDKPKRSALAERRRRERA
jgi:hypothetical protein